MRQTQPTTHHQHKTQPTQNKHNTTNTNTTTQPTRNATRVSHAPTFGTNRAAPSTQPTQPTNRATTPTPPHGLHPHTTRNTPFVPQTVPHHTVHTLHASTLHPTRVETVPWPPHMHPSTRHTAQLKVFLCRVVTNNSRHKKRVYVSCVRVVCGGCLSFTYCCVYCACCALTVSFRCKTIVR